MIDCAEYFQEFTDHHKYMYLRDIFKDKCLEYSVSEREFAMMVQKCLRLANKRCGKHSSKMTWFLYCSEYVMIYLEKELSWYKIVQKL